MVDMVYKNRELFIRFKNIPDDEISGVYDGDCGKIRDEVGVSCYEFINQDNSYKIILSSLSSGFLRDLCFFMEELECNNIPVYLIEAERVGIGSYGEPVVKNIKIIKQLTRLELAEPKPSYKMDITNAQFKDDIIKIDIVTGYSDIKELHTDYIVTDDKIVIDRIWDDYSEFIDGSEMIMEGTKPIGKTEDGWLEVEPEPRPWLIERPLSYDYEFLSISEDGKTNRPWTQDEVNKIQELLNNEGVEKEINITDKPSIQ